MCNFLHQCLAAQMQSKRRWVAGFLQGQHLANQREESSAGIEEILLEKLYKWPLEYKLDKKKHEEQEAIKRQ